MKKVKFDIGGMTCSACSARVLKVSENIEGVYNVNVNLLKNSMTAEIDESITSEQEIIKAIENAGYKAQSTMGDNPSQKTNDDMWQKEMKTMKKRLILSMIFALPLFYIAMGHMMNFPLPDIFHGSENSMILLFTQFLLLIPIVFVNFKFFTVGFKSLWHRAPNMDSLIAIGSASATIYGIYAMYKVAYGFSIRDFTIIEKFSMDIYFESAGMILTLITLGKFLEARAKSKTSDAIKKLMDLTPKKAFLIKDDREIEIPIEDLKQDDIIIVRTGQVISSDGVIIDGVASIDESAITGESIPVDKATGDEVIGGTINKNGVIYIKVTSVGENTTLAQIIKLVDDATSSKAPIEKIADKVSGVFVPSVIGISIITFVFWLFYSKSFEFSLSLAISVLVISCPCALGLATPTAIMVGTGLGVSKGILIKKSEALEVFHKVDTIVLDKTGTITKGEPKIVDIAILEDIDIDKFLSLVYSLEVLSSHPLGKAISNYCKEKNYELINTTDFTEHPGLGISANINGVLCLAGNRKYLEKENVLNLTEEVFKISENFAKEGKTPIYFVADKVLLGIIALADTIKQSSLMAVKQLQKMNINIVMMTGDNHITANAIGKIVGIKDIKSDVMPQDKEYLVSTLQDDGKVVAMVGDGVNDAPALAKADVGIAIGAGTDIAMETADIVLMQSKLTDILVSLKLSKTVLRNIKQNLFWAFIYNVIGIPIAAGILMKWNIKLSPMIAAFAMSLSSVSVVLNALRLKFFNIRYDVEESCIDDDTEAINILKFHSSDENLIRDRIINREGEKEMKKMDIRGMTCPKCVAHVKMALENLEGVTKADVNLQEQSAMIEYDNVSDEELIKAVEDAGYDVMNLY